MESLLTEMGIDCVTYKDERQGSYWFPYTQLLCERNIYLELHQHEIEQGEVKEFEYETSISVYALQGTAVFNCTLFFDERPLVAPSILLGIIERTIKLIEHTPNERLLSILSQLSISAVSSQSIFGFNQLDNQNEVVHSKISLIQSLIAIRHAARN